MKSVHIYPDGTFAVSETYGAQIEMQSITREEGLQTPEVKEVTDSEFEKLKNPKKLTKAKRDKLLNDIINREHKENK